MQCRQCQYPLWNLREPRCPECGTAFDVMSYWFEPGTVVFKCPLCAHPHQGRDMRGMPFDAGRCEGCGQMIVVEQMVIEPVDGKVDLHVRNDRDLAPGTLLPSQRHAAKAVILAIVMLVLMIVLALLLRS